MILSRTSFLHMSLLFLSWWGGLHSHHQSSQHLHLHLSCCHLNLMVVLECSAALHGCAASCTQGLFCMPLEAECANLVVGISISVWWHLCIAQQWSALSCVQSCIASALGWWHEAGESSAMCAAYTHCHPGWCHDEAAEVPQMLQTRATVWGSWHHAQIQATLQSRCRWSQSNQHRTPPKKENGRSPERISNFIQNNLIKNGS